MTFMATDYVKLAEDDGLKPVKCPKCQHMMFLYDDWNRFTTECVQYSDPETFNSDAGKKILLDFCVKLFYLRVCPICNVGLESVGKAEYKARCEQMMLEEKLGSTSL